MEEEGVGDEERPQHGKKKCKALRAIQFQCMVAMRQCTPTPPWIEEEGVGSEERHRRGKKKFKRNTFPQQCASAPPPHLR